MNCDPSIQNATDCHNPMQYNGWTFGNSFERIENENNRSDYFSSELLLYSDTDLFDPENDCNFAHMECLEAITLLLQSDNNILNMSFSETNNTLGIIDCPSFVSLNQSETDSSSLFISANTNEAYSFEISTFSLEENETILILLSIIEWENVWFDNSGQCQFGYYLNSGSFLGVSAKNSLVCILLHLFVACFPLDLLISCGNVLNNS